MTSATGSTSPRSDGAAARTRRSATWCTPAARRRKLVSSTRPELAPRAAPRLPTGDQPNRHPCCNRQLRPSPSPPNDVPRSVLVRTSFAGRNLPTLPNRFLSPYAWPGQGGMRPAPCGRGGIARKRWKRILVAQRPSDPTGQGEALAGDAANRGRPSPALIMGVPSTCGRPRCCRAARRPPCCDSATGVR